jgi:hypothetical protein
LTRKVKKDTANQGRYKPIAFYRLGMAGPTGRIAIYGGEIPGTPICETGYILIVVSPEMRK